ncbi:hypothetical protein ACIGW4_33150 [Streptomyces sp. NPDC053513]|uniref:hypothetical protein n=1 Tax=unclassified Streptomyces TaxID=2593676 RepID=UPI0037CF8D19
MRGERDEAGQGDAGAGRTEHISDEELAVFDRTLARLRALPADAPARTRAEQAAARFLREGRDRRRRRTP